MSDTQTAFIVGASTDLLCELALRLNRANDTFWRAVEPGIMDDVTDIQAKLFKTGAKQQRRLYCAIEAELRRRLGFHFSPTDWAKKRLALPQVEVLGLVIKKPTEHPVCSLAARIIDCDYDQWLFDQADLVEIRKAIIEAMSDTDMQLKRCVRFEVGGGFALIAHPAEGEVRVTVGCKTFTAEEALYIIAKVLEVFPV